MARAYRSPRREADAASTRAAIIAAGEKLFVRDGYAATSLRAIADEAQVSLPTVQQQGGKHSLLIAAFEVAFAGDEGAHSLADRPSMAAIMSEPDFETAVRRYVEFLEAANQRAAGIVKAMSAAADADTAVRAAYDELEQRRHRDMTIAARWFAGRGRIPESSIAAAADVLSYVTGADAYLHFTRSRGWSPQQWSDWTSRQLLTLAEQLPEPTPAAE